MRHPRDKKGMSPVELLIATAVIGGMALIAVIFIDRSLALKKARDLTRFNDVQLIMGSLLLYQIDTAGKIPPGIDDEESTWQMIGLRGQVCTDICPNKKVAPDCAYLDELVPKYLENLPQDEYFTQLGPTGYYINKKVEGNIITVGACYTEVESYIEIKQ